MSKSTAYPVSRVQSSSTTRPSTSKQRRLFQTSICSTPANASWNFQRPSTATNLDQSHSLSMSKSFPRKPSHVQSKSLFMQKQKHIPEYLKWKYGDEILPEVSVLTTNKYFKKYNEDYYKTLYKREELSDQELSHKYLMLKPPRQVEEQIQGAPNIDHTFMSIVKGRIEKKFSTVDYQEQFKDFLIQSRLEDFDKKEFSFAKDSVSFKKSFGHLQGQKRNWQYKKFLVNINKQKQIDKYDE